MKKEMNLTSKIYLLEFLSGMLFYVIGIMLITPETSPVLVKYIILGAMILVEVLILIWIAFNRSEKMDERARINFNKASNLTVILVFFILLVLGIGIQLFSIKFYLSTAILSFVVASMLIIHSWTFRQFEVIGK